MVEDWFILFKRDLINTDDFERSGRLKVVVTSENIKKYTKTFWQTINLLETAPTLKIPKKRVGFILHEHFFTRKLLPTWVPRLFTVDRKQHVLCRNLGS